MHYGNQGNRHCVGYAHRTGRHIIQFSTNIVGRAMQAQITPIDCYHLIQTNKGMSSNNSACPTYIFGTYRIIAELPTCDDEVPLVSFVYLENGTIWTTNHSTVACRRAIYHCQSFIGKTLDRQLIFEFPRNKTIRHWGTPHRVSANPVQIIVTSDTWVRSSRFRGTMCRQQSRDAIRITMHGTCFYLYENISGSMVTMPVS